MRQDIPKAPNRAELPPRRERTALGAAGEALCEIRVKLETSTAVMGGSTRTRVVDRAEVIRAASVRGALRFWWRALHGHKFKTARELFEAEAALWGRAAEEGKKGRSSVEVRILDAKATEIDASTVEPYGRNKHPHAYALFAARGQTGGKTEEQRNNAERYVAGITFELLLRAPEGRAEEVRNTVKAWILFGGYGARTRRGVGSLTVRGDDRARWLPAACTAAALNAHLGAPLLNASATPGDTPSLKGARLFARNDKALEQADRAWSIALDWLADFRQKPGSDDDAARSHGEGRPGRSRWPEADKIRHLSRSWAQRHVPLHNPKPVWPRAGFGLPIVGQFMSVPNDTREPGKFNIIWYGRDGAPRDRLASPLIVKAMPLADGKFVPVALWLNRSFPDGEVGLDKMSGGRAPFNKLVADGDTARYSPLAGITGPDQLQQAFFKWLTAHSYASEVK